MKNNFGFGVRLMYGITKRYPFFNSILTKLGWKKNLLDKSNVFCMAPWIQLHAQTNGHVAPCCMADAVLGRETGDLNDNANLSQQWNSSKMQELRKNMLMGVASPICASCYKYESHGKVSERMNYNRDHKRKVSRLLMTSESGYLEEQSIPILDLRFSNKCNYKCRICNSEYSTLWYEEELKVGNCYGQAPVKEKLITIKQDELWQSLEEKLHAVEQIHFAGGEPLFMDEHYRVLEKLIELGNTDVVLTYNSNFSTLRYKKYDVIELWRKFKRVDLWASLDGMGEKGDYQRKGQKWHKIEDNFREVMRQCTNVQMGVNVTVSVFNVFDVCDFYKYMVQNKFVKPERMNLYSLFGPECFSIVQLSSELKQKAAERIDYFLQHEIQHIENHENFKNHLLSVRTYLFSEQGNMQHVLRERVAAVDALREENFVDVFPELKTLFV